MNVRGSEGPQLGMIWSVSLRDAAYQRLRESILGGALKRGTQLVIEELARELGISRTPLREAIAMLESQGLVETIRNKGIFVTSITEEQAIQIMQVREALEAMAVRLAAKQLPAEEIARLEALFAEHRARIEAGDMQSDRVLNVAFHGTLARFSGNRELAALITNSEERINLYLIATGRQTRVEHMAASFNEHMAILDALRRGDAGEAEQLMVQHLRSSIARSSSVYQQPPRL